MMALAVAAMAGSALLIRLGWGGVKRAAPAGWALAAAALAWLTWRDGAWGLAVGTVAGSIAAVALVLQAGAVSPQRQLRLKAGGSTGEAASGPLALGRRLLVFLAAVPLSFLASLWLAYAIYSAMAGESGLGADPVATMLMVQPVAWTTLMAWQMVLTSPARMAIPPAVAAAMGAMIWLLA